MQDTDNSEEKGVRADRVKLDLPFRREKCLTRGSAAATAARTRRITPPPSHVLNVEEVTRRRIQKGAREGRLSTKTTTKSKEDIFPFFFF